MPTEDRTDRGDTPPLFRGDRPPSSQADVDVTVIVAHDDEQVRTGLATLFEAHGYRVSTATDLATVERAARDDARLLLLPPLLGEIRAVELAGRARELAPDLATLLITCAAIRDLPGDEAALAPLIDERLDRPMAPTQLLEAASAAIWRHQSAARPPMMMSPAPQQRQRAKRTGTARAIVLVAAGYAVILSTDLLLQETRGAHAVDARAAASWRQVARTGSVDARQLGPNELLHRQPSPGAVPPDAVAFEITWIQDQGDSAPSLVGLRLSGVGPPIAPLMVWPDGSALVAPERRVVRILAAFPAGSLDGAETATLVLAGSDEQRAVVMRRPGAEP